MSRMLTILTFLFCFSVNAYSQGPFVCNDFFYQVFGANGDLLSYDADTDNLVVEPNNAGANLNAFGFRVVDGFGYGVFFTPSPDIDLAQLMSDGTVINRGAINGLPTISFPAGDFADDGLLYLYSGGDGIVFNRLFAVNVDNVSVVNTLDIAGPKFSIPDMAFNPIDRRFYGVTNGDAGSEVPPKSLIAIDLVNQTLEVIGLIDLPNEVRFASMFADGSGRVYGSDRTNGILYEFDIETARALRIGETIIAEPGTDTIDGFFCSANPGPSVTKNVPALSDWGLIAMGGVLGIVGFIVLRRKQFIAEA